MHSHFRSADAGHVQGLAGKVIALTEAGDGIGAAAARLLAARGAHVMLGARSLGPAAALAGTLAQYGGSARALAVDVADRRDMQRFISLAHAWFGRLDVIVNSAGVALPSRLDALCVDDWDRMIDVNLRGALHAVAAGLPLLQARGQGQIIHIAARDGDSGGAVHGATQQALRTLSEGLRREVGEALSVTLISLARAEAAGTEAQWCDAGARAIALAVAQAHEADVSEIVVRLGARCSGLETIADQRFPASPSGSRRFFGENGARPRSSGANLN